MLKKAFILPLLLFSISSKNLAQDTATLFREAQQYETKFDDRGALLKYVEILRYQPNNLIALCKSSELHALLGRRQPTKEKQTDYYKISKLYAQHALRIKPNSSEANFVMAFALGRIAIISSGQERLNVVKDIRTYAEKAIQLDASQYKAYHVLGRWHYEVSNLNTVERWLLKMAYGSLPKSSFEMAIRYYEKSRQLNPAFLLNYLELAKSYNRNGNEKRAVELLNAMIKLPLSSSNDAAIKAEGKNLIEKWK